MTETIDVLVSVMYVVGNEPHCMLTLRTRAIEGEQSLPVRYPNFNNVVNQCG